MIEINHRGTEDTKRPLPPGWRWVRLRDVCQVVSGSTPSTDISEFWNGEIVWITPTDLGKLRGAHITTSARQLTEVGYRNCGAELIPVGSVVMSSRAPIGHLGITNVPLCTNQGCKSFVPSASINTLFLYFVLKFFVPKIRALGSGATFTEVSKSQLQNFQILLPPLDEQRVIATQLDHNMAEVARLQAEVQRQHNAIDTLPSAYLHEVFEGGEVQECPRVRLGKVCEINPTRPRNFRRAADTPTTFVPMAAVDGDLGQIVMLEEQPFAKVERGYTYFEEGDVLFAKITPCMQNKKSAIAHNLLDGVGFGTTEFHVIRPGSDITAEWIYYQVREPTFLAAAEAHFTGSAGQQRVPTGFVAQYEVPIPLIEDQHRIVQRLRNAIAEVKQLRAAAEQQRQAADALPSALLHDVFGGFTM